MIIFEWRCWFVCQSESNCDFLASMLALRDLPLSSPDRCVGMHGMDSPEKDLEGESSLILTKLVVEGITYRRVYFFQVRACEWHGPLP